MKYLILIVTFIYSCTSHHEVLKSNGDVLLKELSTYDLVATTFYAKKSIPNSVVKYLKKEHWMLADTGMVYNNTDLILDDRIPNSRIIFGGWVSSNLGFVLYENMGIVSQSNLLIFKTRDKNNVDIEYKFLDCRPKEFLEIRNCASH